MASILTLSIPIPHPDTMCSRTMPSFTKKWHFPQFSTRLTFTHLSSTFSKIARHPSKVDPHTKKSSIKTSMISSRKSANIIIIHLWKVAVALHSPNDKRKFHKDM